MTAHDPEFSSVIFFDKDEALTERDRFHRMGFGTFLIDHAVDLMMPGSDGGSPSYTKESARMIFESKRSQNWQ